MTHNLQVTINSQGKKINKKETHKSEGTHSVDLSLETATLQQFNKYTNYLASLLTEI